MNLTTTMRDAANVIDDVNSHTPAELGHIARAAYHAFNAVTGMGNGPQELTQAAFELAQSNLTTQDIYDAAKLCHDLTT